MPEVFLIMELCLIFVDKCLKANFMKTIPTNIRRKLDKEIASIIKTVSSRNDNISISKENTTFSNFFLDRMLMIQVIRVGVPYSFFYLIQLYSPFSENDWSNILAISTKSLQRYKQGAKNFKSTQSEKIIEMAEVTNIGLDVFGSMEKFKLWLDTPNFALGKCKPIGLLTDSYGKEMVVGELTRINYGILA